MKPNEKKKIQNRKKAHSAISILIFLSILHYFHLTVIWKIPLPPYILKIVNRLLLHKQKDLQQRCFWL